MGMPSRGLFSPRASAASATRAAANPRSKSLTQTAFILPSWRSIRAMASCASSRADTRFAASPADISVAVLKLHCDFAKMYLLLFCRDLRPAEEFEQQPRDLLWLLLLHPMAGALDQMATHHARAGLGLHRLKHARALISPPVLLAGDKATGNINAAAGEGFKLGLERSGGSAAIPLQAALKPGAG